MASPDTLEMSMIKIEIDIAEEAGQWGTQNQFSGITSGCSVRTTITSRDTNSWNPFATVMKESDSVIDCIHAVKAEPVENSVTSSMFHQSLDKTEEKVDTKHERQEQPWLVKEEPQDQPLYSTVQTALNNCSRSPNRSHVCHHCFDSFVLFNSLELHVASIHGEKLHVASSMASTPHGGDAGNYSDVNSGVFDGPWERSSVERTKTKVESTDTDMRIENEKSKQHVCDVCSKVFTRADSLKTHKFIHTSYKPFVCEVCSKAFARAYHLKTHRLTHVSHKPFVCDVCSKAFTQACNLKMHKLIHASHNPFVCDICGKAFRSAYDLKRHKMIHTAHKIKPFLCDLCNKRFSTASNLKAHKQLHTRERTSKCPHCDTDFFASRDLRKHIKSIHAGDKPYVYDACGVIFSDVGYMKDHKKTAEKPYNCDICGVAFSAHGRLQKHRRFHTGEKPYMCTVCRKSFVQSCDLKNHCMIHTGEKPHVCSDCGKGFTQSCVLRNHLLTHTGEKPHTCLYCSTAFTRTGSLKRHVKKFHQ